MEIEIHLAGDAQVAPIKMINIDRIVRRFKVSPQEWQRGREGKGETRKMLSRRCDKTSEQATMDSGQWTRLKLFRRIIDVIEIDCLFVLLACFDWKPNQSPKKVSTRRVSSLGARRTFRRGPLPVSAWVLTAFWLINITFRFGFPFPSPP